MREQKLDENAALKALAKERGISKSEAYRELQRVKGRGKIRLQIFADERRLRQMSRESTRNSANLFHSIRSFANNSWRLFRC